MLWPLPREIGGSKVQVARRVKGQMQSLELRFGRTEPKSQPAFSSISIFGHVNVKPLLLDKMHRKGCTSSFLECTVLKDKITGILPDRNILKEHCQMNVILDCRLDPGPEKECH